VHGAENEKKLGKTKNKSQVVMCEGIGELEIKKLVPERG